MTDFSERLAALTPEQRALFELRRKQKGLSEVKNQAITRRKPAPYHPLSFDQMRLWFLYQLAPHNTAYNITGAVRLTGPLNPDVLERAINEIIRRHEILRTTFANIDEQPVQIVAPQLTIKMTRVDLSHLSPEEQDIEMPRVATEYAQAPFDLVNGPLIRASLLRLADEDHILVSVMQHIVTDRWSYTLFEQELAILYHAFSNRLPSPLPELPIQFADFAIWQQQWMQSEKMQSELDFWKRQLADAPPIHPLPTDHQRPTVVSFQGGRHEIDLSPAAVAGVRALAKQSNTTIFITLLSLFKVLLARESDQTDIVVGTPIANRGRPELEKLIGFFLNTLIFRTNLAKNPTFREYLAQVREIASEAYARQDVPFERLVAELRPERDTSRNPLYQITFLFLDFEDPQELADLPGVKVKTVDVDTEDARFDITLALWSDPQRIYGVLEYNRDLFDPPTIAAYVEHFNLLVEQIVVNPDLRIFDIPCLTEAEERQLLVDWNATASDYPRDRLVPELITEQAARTPESVALVFEDRSLSYAELDARSNQLAHHLRALGVTRETRVGVYLHRSPELLVALLAIHKAGAAYVPLDPSYPAARLEFMLADAGIAVLVTQEVLAENLPHTGITLCLDRDAVQIATQPTTPLSSTIQPEDLAYIIYTSGSTGQPKGVQIPHRALANFLHAMQREPGITTDDTLLAVTTIAFDIAGLELFLPLMVGARIVLVDRDTAIDGAQLAALLHTSGATIMQATPATWRLLLAANWHGTPGLRALCGGEALPLDLAQHLLPRVDQLWNLYGPTETTIWSAATRVQAEDERIALGPPIANTQLYVLDRHQRLAPVGVPGELYIGGDGVARGYNNRPDLTAERFVPDPFSQTPGARLYRTGDLVRYRYDGKLEFHGRVDTQIKLRGYRIELGEIEQALRQQPEVRDVAVMVRDDRLVAYVVG
ncbi:MAG: amino acid adenylation domain-containing protein, partial [Chloroflexi bacterium]|nr:amino acid adenylation domain-containing protein [Chloroflexota bacterium]